MTAELTLRDYFDILRRRAWLIVVGLLAALTLALIYSALQTPLYQSSSEVLINQTTSTDLLDPNSGTTTNTTFADRQATTAVQLLESQLVDREAESVLGYEATISARAESRADVVVVTGINADPVRARDIAQTYAVAYLDIRRSEFSQERLATAEELLETISGLEAEIDSLGDSADRTRKQTLRDDLADTYDRLLISASIGNNGSARIIEEAPLPTDPVSPRTTRNLILGGVIGLMLGAGGALLLESLDTSIKTREVIEALAPGVPALASIPKMKSDSHVISMEHLDGLETEVFRTLRAGVEFASVDRPLQVIQVTSAGASAGKTTVVANLAVVMAQSGKRVAVVDCDLRRPRLHTAFNVPQDPGISSLIIGRSTGTDASHALDLNNGRLWVFPSGPIPPGPSELLGSERAEATFRSLRKSLDVILIDSPPVLPVSDALVLSRIADATIVVANARSTKRADLVRALEQLEQAGANVVGTVLNEVKANANGGYGYGYGYGYGHSSGGGVFGRSRNNAPMIDGTATISRTELPQFKAARTADLRPSKSMTAISDAIGASSWLDTPATSDATAIDKDSAKSSESRSAQRRKSAERKRRAPGGHAADQQSASRVGNFSEQELDGWGDDVELV